MTATFLRNVSHNKALSSLYTFDGKKSWRLRCFSLAFFVLQLPLLGVPQQLKRQVCSDDAFSITKNFQSVFNETFLREDMSRRLP